MFLSFILVPPQIAIVGEPQPRGDYDISVEMMVMRDKSELGL